MPDLTQHKCPMCQEYRRSFIGDHGIIKHLFFDHKLSGDEIQLMLLDPQANGYGRPIHAMGNPPLPADWWEMYVATKKEDSNG